MRGLSKSYGRANVLTDVFLNVIPGEVYALTGPNGAGKTTLIRMLTGLAFPTRGEVRIMGVNVHTDGPRARALMGAVVEAPAKFYPQFTGTENLKIHASLTGAGVGPGRISEVLARRALETGASMIVMGAYGHSRFREAILGGATRNMLEAASLPVLLARVAARTTNPYGGTPAQRAEIAGHVETVEPLLRAAATVLLDATLIRMLLVPAFMRVAGVWNWWAPAPLKKVYDRVGLRES